MELVIQLERKGKAEFYVVLVKLKFREVRKFLRCFYTFRRAHNFIADLKIQVQKGNYEWLTLKS